MQNNEVAAMPPIDPQPVPKVRLRWYQFRLRSLFLVMLLSCIGMSWVGVRMERGRRQKEAVEETRTLGGAVVCDYELDSAGYGIRGAQPTTPRWLRHLLGDDFFTNVDAVSLANTRATNAGLEHLKGLTQLRYLSLDGTKVTDPGVEHLRGMTQLQYLSLSGTKVTDAGLRNMKRMPHLRELSLNFTQVTDAGLENLKGLPQLEKLWLTSTEVTDEGVKRLQQALPKCQISH